MKLILVFFIIFYNFLCAEVTPISNDKTGYLIDSLVDGVNYKCSDDSYKGITGDFNGKGSFKITNDCSNIIFTLNDKVILGDIKISDISYDDKYKGYPIYITDLVGLSTNDTTNTKVKNMIRVLQTLDDDLDYTNNISIIARNNITESKNFNDNLNENDLNNIIKDAGYSNRTLISELCALVNFEQTLKENNIKVDTVPPCQPQLVYEVNATANNQTYIELTGEKYVKIFLNGNDTNLTLDSDGKYLEFELNTIIRSNNFHDFNLTYVDDINQTSQIKTLRIFNDTDQPNLNNFPTDINISAGTTNILDINASDNSLDNNISINYEVNDTKFEIDTTGNLHFKNNATIGTYKIKVRVIDQVLHWDESNLTINVQ